MRLRSSQFVFLLLLACSVQPWESLAAPFASGTTTQVHTLALARADRATLHPLHLSPATLPGARKALPLPAHAAAAFRIVWAMRRPARDSAAVSSFSSFLRS